MTNDKLQGETIPVCSKAKQLSRLRRMLLRLEKVKLVGADQIQPITRLFVLTTNNILEKNIQPG